MTNPRSITEAERPWIENWSPETNRVLLDAVRERDTVRMALNLCSYVAARALGERSDIVGPSSRTQYRKLLAELADEGITPPAVRVGASSRRRRSESGVAQLATTAAVGAAGLAVTGHPALAAVVYITYTAGADDSAAAPSGGEVAGIHTLRAAPADDMPTYYTPVAA